MRRLFLVLFALGCAVGCAEPDAPAAVHPRERGDEPAERAAAPPPSASACPAEDEGVTLADDRLLVAGRIGFDLYQSTLAPESLERIDAVAHRLRACPELEVEVEVHTDSMRMGVFNARASRAIAEAIRARLVASGADGRRIAACGYGESRPIAPNTTAEGRATNMRVDFMRLSDPASAWVCPTIE